MNDEIENRTCLMCEHFTVEWDWEDGNTIWCEGKDVWILSRDNTESFRNKMKTANYCEFYKEVA